MTPDAFVEAVYKSLSEVAMKSHIAVANYSCIPARSLAQGPRAGRGGLAGPRHGFTQGGCPEDITGIGLRW